MPTTESVIARLSPGARCFRSHRTLNELTAALYLTDNAMRAHLLSLERDGLVQPRGTRRGTRKPHVDYELSAEAEQIFPKAYGPLLNHLVGAISDRLTFRALRASMQEVASPWPTVISEDQKDGLAATDCDRNRCRRFPN